MEPCGASIGRAKHIRSDDDRRRLVRRLSLIEGQVRGVRRMLDDERDCRDVMQQLTAVRAAVQSLGVEVVRCYAIQEMEGAERDAAAVSDGQARSDVLTYVIDTLTRWA